MRKSQSLFRKVWHFIWEEDSLLSWIVNVALAFIIIKFLVYPGLGFILKTDYPVVAVVSGSMEHPQGFEAFWDEHHLFYERIGISKEDFSGFHFKNGFNKGDIIVLYGDDSVGVGDVIVFAQGKPDPIIHRIVKKWEENGSAHYQTKGDNNQLSIASPEIYELDVPEHLVIGKALFRIPYFGWVKIVFVEFINIFR